MESGRFNVYKKEEIPERWHMKNTSRMDGKIYLLAKPGYAFWNDFLSSVLKQTSKHFYESRVLCLHLKDVNTFIIYITYYVKVNDKHTTSVN